MNGKFIKQINNIKIFCGFLAVMNILIMIFINDSMTKLYCGIKNFDFFPVKKESLLAIMFWARKLYTILRLIPLLLGLFFCLILIGFKGMTENPF